MAFKNFGLSTNMTLPVSGSSIEPDPKVMAESAYMPGEGNQKRKKHARFAPDKEQVPPEHKDAAPPRKASWGRRFTGWFRRSRKADRSGPYAVHAGREDDDEHLVRIVHSESDPELSIHKKELGAAKPQRRKAKSTKSSRTTTSLSTAFEHIDPVSNMADQAATVHIIFKPKSGGTIRKVLLHCRKDSEEGLGLHLSGGLPPVTVTYVKPGSKAEQAGLGVGDTILEVNGLNCKKKVDISQLMALKMLVQQPLTADQDIDEVAWGKIKAKQDDLESETSKVKVTSIDSEKEEDSTPAGARDEPKKKKTKKKRLSSSRASDNGDPGDPLAASSPIKEGDGMKKKKKKKRASLVEAEANDKIKKSRSITEDGDEKKSSPRKSATSEASKEGPKSKRASLVEAEANDKIKKSRSITEDGDKKTSSPRKSASISEASKEGSKSKKKRSKTSLTEDTKQSPAKKSSKSSRSSQSGVKIVKAEVSDVSREAERCSPPPQQTSISVDAVDGSQQMYRSDRNRRSSSPKSRYHMGEAETQPEKVTVSVKEEPQKSKKKKSKSHSGQKKKDVKKGKSKEEPSSRRVSVAKTPTEDPSSPEGVELSSPHSAAVSGSIESNTLTFVSREKKSSLTGTQLEPQETQAGHQSDANTLPRRSKPSPINHSTSVSNLKDKTASEFREELREASKSQHDVRDAVNTSVTIEIDPNIKVKKSGLIKEGKTPLRPSIFDQSSSPEPEEMSPSSSSGPVEDKILDPELKVKKSGLMMGKKTSASVRPSILDEKQKKTSPSDIEPGEMKYNRMVKEEANVDLSAVPHITPSLGLVEGRDRRDASNRNRRPASLRQSLLLDSKENEIMGTERVDLSNLEGRRGTLSGKTTPSGGNGGSSRLAAARQLFESQQETKSAEKPVIAMRGATAKKLPEASGKETPSWITLAQERKKRGSTIEEKGVAPAAPSHTTTATSIGGKPEMGHVAKRLAMFQKH